MCIAVKSSKIGFFHVIAPVKQTAQHAAPLPSHGVHAFALQLVRLATLRIKKQSSRKTENTKALVFSSPSEIFVKGHELQTCGVILGSHNCGTDPHGIRSSERV
jgi:hypothetical protein